MATHLQAREITCADGMQKRGRSLGEIVAKLQRGRSPKRNRGPSKNHPAPQSSGATRNEGHRTRIQYVLRLPRIRKHIVTKGQIRFIAEAGGSCILLRLTCRSLQFGGRMR